MVLYIVSNVNKNMNTKTSFNDGLFVTLSSLFLNKQVIIRSDDFTGNPLGMEHPIYSLIRDIREGKHFDDERFNVITHIAREYFSDVLIFGIDYSLEPASDDGPATECFSIKRKPFKELCSCCYTFLQSFICNYIEKIPDVIHEESLTHPDIGVHYYATPICIDCGHVILHIN